MPRRSHVEIVADQLPALSIELTRHRRGSGPHWLMVADLRDARARHGITISDDDLQAAIALCIERHTMKAAGNPVHSISPWQRDWNIRRPA